MDFGAAVLAVAVLAFIGWLTYAVTRGPARPTQESPPPNLEPYSSDDELESKRLTKVLAYALVSTALLALMLPIYFLNEENRQAAAAEFFDNVGVERGSHWWTEFQCVDCHGPTGGGGSASSIEPRSGMATGWAAPPLDDVFLRYDLEEVRHWIVYGRPGTPMPAWGVEGGGPLTWQQVDEIMDYIHTLQIGPQAAFEAVDTNVSLALSRIDTADATLDEAIADMEDEIDSLIHTASLFPEAERFDVWLRQILTSVATCTEESAELFNAMCDTPRADSDRDGLSDIAEAQLNDYLAELLEFAPPSNAATNLSSVSFDPTNPFTNDDREGRPVPDLLAADQVLANTVQIIRDIRLTSQNFDRLIGTAERNLAFLIEAREEQRYAIDFDALAADSFDGNLDDARRAAGLYNAYCARCHTGGYAAGVAFTQEAGSGAWGPSLLGGRSVLQFPDIDDHVQFLIDGSDESVAYGVNGLGTGRMPSFGTFLSERDLTLIAIFERGLP